MQNLKQLLNLKSLNFYGHTLAAGVSCSLHNLADSLCYSAVASDYHTCVALSNGERKLNIISVNLFDYVYGIGLVNKGARDVRKYFLKIHFGHVFQIT